MNSDLIPLPSKSKPASSEIHIDDFLDNWSDFHNHPELSYPHFMFSHWRLPAIIKMAHRPFMKQFELYVDYEGRSWRVTGASRLGDIWLSEDFSRESGYDRRAQFDLSKFTNWRPKADWELTVEEQVILAEAAGMKWDPERHKSVTQKLHYLANWSRSNGLPKRYIATTPQQRDLLRRAGAVSVE